MPDEKLAGELQTTRNKNVIMIRRLFYTEGAPVAYDVKYLLYQKGMPIVEKEIEHATFPEMISKSMPLFALKKELMIYAQIPGEEIKRYRACFWRRPDKQRDEGGLPGLLTMYTLVTGSNIP